MDFIPTIKIADLVAIVIDEHHQRYGSLAKVLIHDWADSGKIFVQYCDGTYETFQDGIMKGDSPSPIARYIRHPKGTEEVNIYQLQIEYLKRGGTIPKLRDEYQTLFGHQPHLRI